MENVKFVFEMICHTTSSRTPCKSVRVPVFTGNI